MANLNYECCPQYKMCFFTKHYYIAAVVLCSVIRLVANPAVEASNGLSFAVTFFKYKKAV